MKRSLLVAACASLVSLSVASGKEARLVRYPDYANGKIAFSFMGDIWTADDNGKNVQRLTVHKARDIHPKFSPDGRWIAFSSDREGNLDVYAIPVTGGSAERLTINSADETVIDWTPDGKGILFTCQKGEDFLPKLYVAPHGGGLPRDAGPDIGLFGSYSPDGSKLAINRKSQSYWRKYYRGAYQSDITVMDLASKTFKDIAPFDGMDSWPLWGTDGFIYFVSDREGKGLTNIFRVPEAGGDVEQVTRFKDGDVRFPGMSHDGKTIVFEHDFVIWKLDIPSKETRRIDLDIAGETQEDLVEYLDFNSTVDDFDSAPSGKRIAFSVHGEIFTAPIESAGGELRQLTDGAARDQRVEYSPDGKRIAFVSDKDGREEIYVIAEDGSGETKRVTDLDSLKQSYAWSPDSKAIALTTSEGKLYTVSAEGKDLKEIASSKYGSIGMPAWSPDGKMLAYSKPDVSRSSDIYVIPSEGGEEKKISFDSSNESNPKFSADGTKVYFTRMEGEMSANERPSSQIFCVPLEKLTSDPLDTPDEQADAGDNAQGGGPGGPGGPAAMRGRMMGQGRPVAVKTSTIDWSGLKRRTRQVTRAGSVMNFIVGIDGKTLYFMAGESTGAGGGRPGAGAGGFGGARSIYSIQDDGKRLTRIAAGATPTADAAPTDRPRGGRGFGGGGGGLKLTKDGRTLFYQEGQSVLHTPVSGGGGGAPAAATALFSGARGQGGGGGGGGGRGGDAAPADAQGANARGRVAFNVSVRVDKPKQWDEMFDDAWRCMKYRFYDPKLHGADWDAMRAKYHPLVEYVADTHELMNIINEMIGELNASHTGAAPGAGGGRRGGGGGGPAGPSTATKHLGIELVSDDAAGRYKVTHVYEDGPADHDWIKLSVGNYLIEIDGKPIKAGDDYEAFLGRRLNAKVQLTLSEKPSAEGSWKVKYEPIAASAFANLRYERWVKDRRAIVDKISGGRVGYLHIKAMDQPSLARFKKELGEYRHKEGLVIDQRFNGGGNIEQELLAILVQRPYEIWQPRGTEPTERPFSGYFGPKVVVQNWRSASNAEMFPAGFRALGLGKVVGTPTMGAVIGTGSYSLIDGSTVRTPGVGVYLADSARTNMENHAVQPDISIENSPEDNLAGKDRQIETATAEVMKSLKSANTTAGGAGR